MEDISVLKQQVEAEIKGVSDFHMNIEEIKQTNINVFREVHKTLRQRADSEIVQKYIQKALMFLDPATSIYINEEETLRDLSFYKDVLRSLENKMARLEYKAKALDIFKAHGDQVPTGKDNIFLRAAYSLITSSMHPGEFKDPMSAVVREYELFFHILWVQSVQRAKYSHLVTLPNNIKISSPTQFQGIPLFNVNYSSVAISSAGYIAMSFGLKVLLTKFGMSESEIISVGYPVVPVFVNDTLVLFPRAEQNIRYGYVHSLMSDPKLVTFHKGQTTHVVGRIVVRGVMNTHRFYFVEKGRETYYLVYYDMMRGEVVNTKIVASEVVDTTGIPLAGMDCIFCSGIYSIEGLDAAGTRVRLVGISDINLYRMIIPSQSDPTDINKSMLVESLDHGFQYRYKGQRYSIAAQLRRYFSYFIRVAQNIFAVADPTSYAWYLVKVVIP